jgi:predicted nucleic acid-binding protein
VLPKDDKFLEVALNGKADLILTGDADLLALHPLAGCRYFVLGELSEEIMAGN